MATIPRYKKEQVNAQVVTEKFGGLADQATAQGQAGIAQAQKGLAGQHGQRARQEIQSLGQRLNQFSSLLDSVMKNNATSEGKKSGIEDVSKRREEIYNIRQKYPNNIAKQNEEISKVATATAEDSFSIYGRVYQQSRDAAYVDQANLDASDAVEYARLASGDDPEMFKDSYKEYWNKRVMGAPTELTRIATDKAFQARGVKTYGALYRAKEAKEAQDARDLTNSTISDLEDNAPLLMAENDIPGAADAVAHYTAILQSKVNNGEMDPTVMSIKVKKFKHKMSTEAIMNFGNTMIGKGEGNTMIAALLDVKDGKVDMSQGDVRPEVAAYAAMSASEQDDIIKKLRSKAKAAYDADVDDTKQTNEKNDLASKEMEKRVMGILSGKDFTGPDGDVFTAADVTEESIDELEANHSITEEAARRLKDKILASKTRQNSEHDSITFYANDENLISVPTDIILNDPTLSLTDAKALSAKRQLLENGKYKWSKSDPGIEGLRRIKELFNIPESGFSFQNLKGKKHAAYRKMRDDYYKTMSSYDDPQMAVDFAIEKADMLIEVYEKNKKAVQEKEDAETAEKIKKIQDGVNGN